MLNMGKTLNRIVLFGLFLLITNDLLAADNLIISEICVQRAHEIGIFSDHPDIAKTKERLTTSRAPLQVFDFEKLSTTYEDTLQEIEKQLENYQSPLFKFLQNCKNNEKDCHGYFQTTNPLHIKIFCDREILRSSLQSILKIKDARYDICTRQPFVERDLGEIEETHVSYDKMCFEKKERDGKMFLVNKAEQYFQELARLNKWRERMVDRTFNAIKSSLLPEGLEFILRKTIEEFEDVSISKAKINDLNVFYRTSELISEFQKCCNNSNVELPEGKLSLTYLDGTGEIFFKSHPKPAALTLKVNDYLSELIFLEAERQYWKTILSTRSPLRLNEQQKLAYFRFLQIDPLFYHSYEKSFYDLIAEAKTKKRNDFKPAQLSRQEQEKYEAQFGYKYVKPRSYELQDKNIPEDQRLAFDYGPMIFNEKELIGNFIFNPDFKNLYMKKIEETNEKNLSQKFEYNKSSEYPKIFDGFLPYQFIRTNHAAIVRELQKIRRSEAASILRDIETFHKWADSVSCKGFENTFCSASKNKFRLAKHAELYEKIITGIVPLDYAPENTPQGRRKYIYASSYIKQINQQIQTINKFCWETADPNSFKKNPKKFEEKTKSLDSKIEQFYSMPRMEELLGQNSFLELLEFKPSEYSAKCFTKGYLFGDSGYYSALGNRLTSPQGISSPGIPVSLPPSMAFTGVSIQQAYIPSIFKIKKDDIENIEDEIQERIREEFYTLQEALQFNELSDKSKFLEESSTIRLFALIDYAIDNPSAEVGKYLCNMIVVSDANEYSAIQMREFIIQATLVAASVVTVFTLPGIFASGAAVTAATAFKAAGTSVIYESGTALVFTGISAGYALYNIKHFNHKNNLINISATTKNILPKDAMNLHEFYDEHISEAKIQIMMDVALLVVVGSKPIIQSSKYIQKILDKKYMLFRRDRQNIIEEFIRTAPESEFYITRQMEDFLFDYKAVSKKEFDEFFTAFSKGNGKTFISQHWENQLGKYLPMEKLQPKPWKQKMDELVSSAKQIPAIRKPYEWLAEKNSIFLKPSWYRLKPYYHQYFLNYFGKSLNNETRLVKMFENSKVLSKKINREIFSEEEIAQYASKMKHYKMSKDGVFVRVANEDLEKIISRFLLRSGGDSYALRAYLTPLINGELLTVDEWKLVLKSFTHQLRNIDDCKTLLKTIKYAKKEYSDLWQQFRNFPELANRKEVFNRKNIFNPYVYKKRFKIIANRIDEFYEIAQYTRYRNNVKTVEDFQELMQSTGKSMDEIETSIRMRHPEFSLKRLFENYEQEKMSVGLFNENLALVPKPGKIKQTTREFFKDEDALARSYKKQFLEQEKDIQEYFHKKLMKNFQKESDIGLAYQKAYIRTKVRKNTEYECSLPDSKVRKEANQAYKRLAGYVSLSTNFMGYYAVHGDEEMTQEWLSRFTYEVTTSFLGGQLQAQIFTKGGGGPLYKITHDLLSGMLITSLDGVVYGTINNLSWNKKEKFQKQFAKMIYESGNVSETIHQYFEKYPEIEERILLEYKKVQKSYDAIELKHGKGIMVDSDMEDEFLRAGLIDNILYSDMELKDRELGKNYIYHDLIDSGYLDKELYQEAKTDKELENQLMELISDFVYQDLYDHKSGKISYPFMDPIDLGNHKYLADLPIFPDIPGVDIDLPGVDIPVEAHTGSETLDRMIFWVSYDMAKTPVAYLKNNLTYRILCNGRFLPGNMNVASAIALHAIYKAGMDPLKFYLREQATGR